MALAGALAAELPSVRRESILGNPPYATCVTTLSGPRPCVSAAPSQRQANTALIAALDRASLSARGLTRRINDKLKAVGEEAIHPTAGYNWCGGATPRSALVRRLAAVVLSEASSTEYTVTDLWGPGGAERPALSATDDLVGPRPLLVVLPTTAIWTNDSAQYAAVRTATPDQMSAAVWDATRQQGSTCLGLDGPDERVHPPLMASLEERLQSLRRLDDQMGGGPLSQRQVRTALFEVVLLLRTSTFSSDIRTRLLRNAAGLAQLGGWMAFDGSLAAAAQRYQLLAIRLAQAAGDHDSVANILGMLAYQHAAHARPAEALRFAISAVEHSARCLPLVRARALGRLATAHASAGDIDGFRRAADQCRSLITLRTPEDPPSLYYFTDEQLAAESGHALVELAVTNPRRSRALLTEAFDLLSPFVSQGSDGGYQRSAVLHGIHLARARLLTKDSEATAHALTAVAGQVASVQSLRCRALLVDLRRHAGPRLRSGGRSDAIEAVDRALSAA